jgi:hypothetical protein
VLGIKHRALCTVGKCSLLLSCIPSSFLNWTFLFLSSYISFCLYLSDTFYHNYIFLWIITLIFRCAENSVFYLFWNTNSI